MRVFQSLPKGNYFWKGRYSENFSEILFWHAVHGISEGNLPGSLFWVDEARLLMNGYGNAQTNSRISLLELHATAQRYLNDSACKQVCAILGINTDRRISGFYDVIRRVRLAFMTSFVFWEQRATLKISLRIIKKKILHTTWTLKIFKAFAFATGILLAF